MRGEDGVSCVWLAPTFGRRLQSVHFTSRCVGVRASRKERARRCSKLARQNLAAQRHPSTIAKLLRHQCDPALQRPRRASPQALVIRADHVGLNSFEAAAEAAADNDKRSPPEEEVQALQTLSPRRSALGTFVQTPIEACAAPDQTQQPDPVPHLLWRCANGAARLAMVFLCAWAPIEHGMAWKRPFEEHVRPGCSGSRA